MILISSPSLFLRMCSFIDPCAFLSLPLVCLFENMFSLIRVFSVISAFI